MSDTECYEPKDEDVRILRDWLRKSPHIVQDYDDEFLKGFIRGCKGRLEKTKCALENFNGLNIKYPEFFGHLDVSDKKMQEYLSVGRIFLLPGTLENGSSVIFASLDIYDDNHDPYKLHFNEMFRYLHMLFYVTMWERTAKDKLTIIFDWRKMVLLDFREVTPMFVKRILDIVENCMPLRLQAVHNVYVPPVLEYFFNLGKSLAKKKIADRIFFHSKMDTFFNSVPKEILPKDYGGEEPDINTLHAQWKQKVEDYRDRLMEEHSKMKRLDALRPKTDANQEMVGTFRTLNVD